MKHNLYVVCLIYFFATCIDARDRRQGKDPGTKLNEKCTDSAYRHSFASISVRPHLLLTIVPNMQGVWH